MNNPPLRLVTTDDGGVNVVIDDRCAAYFPAADEAATEQIAFLVEEVNRAWSKRAR